MTRVFIFIAFFLTTTFLSGQELVINELDCDTPGIDDKEFVELRSNTPNFPLDGYVIVFFNGSVNGGNTAYLAFDLDGYSTDINGIFLIGSSTVIPFPQYQIDVNLIQNGADAVAIYKANAEDFPEGTIAYVNDRLVDVLIYGTNDALPISLVDIFKAFNPLITLINEGQGNNTNSIQRNNDGTYFSGTPSPRLRNDGTGIILNGILLTASSVTLTEGQTFNLVFTTEQTVTEDLTIPFTINNGNFTNADFIANTSITIPKDTKTISTTIQLIDDTDDEGDEEMLVKMGSVPPTYLPLNNNVVLRVLDNDYKVAPFGTPLHSTYGIVDGNQAADYYDALIGKADEDLRNEMQAIISNADIVRTHTYADVIDILKDADQNPENSNQVWLVYREKGRSKLDVQTSSNNLNTWNREHTWPRSRGGFNSINGDDLPDGINFYWPTNADSTRHANSDAHAIRAEDGQENSSRGNQFYGQYAGPQGTLGGFKGDVARSIFYLDVRYNGLEVVKGYPEGEIGKFGDLDTLLQWHRNDPPDDFEMNRNNVVYQWQRNRNPFIDHGELVEFLWGKEKGKAWTKSSAASDEKPMPIAIFPNPAANGISFKGVSGKTKIEIFNGEGKTVLFKEVSEDFYEQLILPSGIYIVKFDSKGKISYRKLVID